MVHADRHDQRHRHHAAQCRARHRHRDDRIADHRCLARVRADGRLFLFQARGDLLAHRRRDRADLRRLRTDRAAVTRLETKVRTRR